jgi:hypothetical protein
MKMNENEDIKVGGDEIRVEERISKDICCTQVESKRLKDFFCVMQGIWMILNISTHRNLLHFTKKK